MKTLDKFIEELIDVFKKNEDRYKAHELAKDILIEIGKDNSILQQIIDLNIKKESFFSQKRITPVVALDIEVNDMFSFIAHCWLPQPDLDIEMTNQSIHHHGDLLLTSLAAYGPGYESILFKKDFSYNKNTLLAKLEIDKIYKNPHMNIEFVDKYTPHVVFYPDSLSITFALWSNYKAKPAEKLRNSGFIQRNRKLLRKVIDKLNLAASLGLNQYQYVDFFPNQGEIFIMKDRIRYPVGSEKSFAHGFFNVISNTGYKNFDYLKNQIEKSNANEKKLYLDLIERLKQGGIIEDKFENSHMNIAKVNIKKSDVLECFPS